MLILLWQQTVADAGALTCNGDSDCAFDGGAIAAGRLTSAGSSTATFDGDTSEQAPVVTPTDGGGSSYRAPVRRSPRARFVEPIRREPTTFAVLGDGEAAFDGAAAAGSSVESFSDSAARFVGSVHAATAFAVNGTSHVELGVAGRFDTTFVGGGDAAALLAGAVEHRASFEIDAKATSSFTGGALPGSALVGLGSSEVALFGQAAASSTLTLSALTEVAARSTGRARAAFRSEATSYASMASAPTAGAQFEATGIGAVVFDGALALAVAPLVEHATAPIAEKSTAAWTSLGAAIVTLASRAQAPASFVAVGSSGMDIAAIARGNREVADRLYLEAFGEEPRVRADDAQDRATGALRRTATYVAMQRRIGGVGKRRKVQRARQPTLIEADYAAQLVAVVDSWKQRLEPLFAELPAMLETVRREHHDNADKVELETRLGLLVVIENPVGSVRYWTDSDGTEGQTTMKHAYGFIDGVRGVDGEEVDVYLGPNEAPEWVYVVHQNSKASGFVDYDEDKVMLGWNSADDARAAYLAQYSDPRFFGGMTMFSAEDFVDALAKVDGDALTHQTRLDIGEARRTRILLDKARDDVAASAAAVEWQAQRYGKQVSQHGKGELDKQVKAGLGLAIPFADLNLNGKLEHFAHENAGLIKSLSGSYISDVEKAVLQAYARGDRWETLAKNLEARHGIAQRHARLIARDQIVTLNAQLTRSRHKELGIARFRWLTMRDPRVRPRHRPMEGKVFAYTGEGKPPFMPGEEVLCRCQELPIFEDIHAEVDRILTPPPVEQMPLTAVAIAEFVGHREALVEQAHAMRSESELEARRLAEEADAEHAAARKAAKKAAAVEKARAIREANKARRRQTPKHEKQEPLSPGRGS